MADETHDELDDRLDDDLTNEELARLFSSFDDVTASDELKAKTLGRIFGDQGEADQDTTNQEGDEAELLHLHAEKRPRHMRRRSLWRVAAAIILALVIAGTTAYALPVSHVSVTQGDVTVELGVNVFGITVSATSDTDEGQALIDEADVRGKSFSEGINSVMLVMDEHADTEQSDVTVQVDSPFKGQQEQLEGESERVQEQHRETGAETKTETEPGTKAEPEEEAEAQSQPEPQPEERQEPGHSQDVPADDGRNQPERPEQAPASF